MHTATTRQEKWNQPTPLHGRAEQNHILTKAGRTTAKGHTKHHQRRRSNRGDTHCARPTHLSVSVTQERSPINLRSHLAQGSSSSPTPRTSVSRTEAQRVACRVSQSAASTSSSVRAAGPWKLPAGGTESGFSPATRSPPQVLRYRRHLHAKMEVSEWLVGCCMWAATGGIPRRRGDSATAAPESAGGLELLGERSVFRVFFSTRWRIGRWGPG